MKLRLIALLGLLALVLASCGGATPQASGPNEGIQIHGDWTIEVLDPDGTVAQRHQFSNALESAGEEVLAMLLTREATTGIWSVTLQNTTGDSPCSTAGGICIVAEAATPSIATSYNLAVSVADTSTVQLIGSLEADQDGQVSRVFSDFRLCEPSTSPEACIGAGFGPAGNFTSTDIPLVDVAQGQSIQVQVDISFTSG